MAYVKQNFVDGNVLYASELNHIEDGIADAALDDLSNVANDTVVGKINTGAITAAKIATNAVSTLYTATIPANGWASAEDGTYQEQTISVSGVLTTDHIIVDYRGAGQTGALQMESLEDYGLIFRMDIPSNGNISVYASDSPTHDLPINILCIRK